MPLKSTFFSLGLGIYSRPTLNPRACARIPDVAQDFHRRWPLEMRETRRRPPFFFLFFFVEKARGARSGSWKNEFSGRKELIHLAY